jgi:hypothetical protein
MPGKTVQLNTTAPCRQKLLAPVEVDYEPKADELIINNFMAE